jgi:hypothetical protein
MILRLDWLLQFGPIVVYWNQKWIELKKEGKIVKLQVQSEHSMI